jgi:hypothetical protein
MQLFLSVLLLIFCHPETVSAEAASSVSLEACLFPLDRAVNVYFWLIVWVKPCLK